MQHTANVSPATAVPAITGAAIVADAETKLPPLPRATTVTAKATVARDAFLVAVNNAVRVIERRNTIAILGNVHLKASDGALRVSGTDCDIVISQPISAETLDTDFAVTAPAYMLQAILKKAPAGTDVAMVATDEITWRHPRPHEKDSAGKPITGPVKETSAKLELRIGRTSYNLDGLPAKDWPELSAQTFTANFTLCSADLFRALDRTMFAISTEETRYYLNGVYMHACRDHETKLRFIATDGHRLASAEFKAPEAVSTTGPAAMPGVIIPRKTVGELHRLLKAKGGQDVVSVTLNQAQVIFTYGDVTIRSKLVDGSFPDYARVIPRGNDKHAVLDREELIEAIDQVSVISTERGRAVKLSLRQDECVLSVTNPDAGSARQRIECDYPANPLDIGFNSRYLVEILKEAKSARVRVELADPGSPTLIVGQDADDAGLMFVLMPMRV